MTRLIFPTLVLLLIPACSPPIAGSPTSEAYDASVALLTDGAEPDDAARACVGESWAERDEVEPHVAASPANPDHLVAAWMLRAPGGPGGVQVAVSSDGGDRWSSPRTLPFGQCAGGDPDSQYASDPWLSMDESGRAYVSIIEYTPSDNPEEEVSRLLVASSVDGGYTWAPPEVVGSRADTGEMHDNTSVASRIAGTAYVTATRYLDRTGPAAVATTTNGGVRWSDLTPTPLVSTEAPFALAPQLLIGTGGAPLWLIYGHDPGGANVAVARSDDGGTHWTQPATIASWTRPRNWPLFPGTEDELQVAPDIVSSGIHPPTSHLWIAHPSADGSGRPTIALLGSADAGERWVSTEVIGPDEVGWRPTLAVAEDGLVVLTWFRPSADGPVDAEHPTAVEAAWFSPRGDGGATLLDRTTIDRFDWTPRRGGALFLGDYHGLVTTNEGATAVYSRATPDGMRVGVRRIPAHNGADRS